jgi:hypothetical protein
MKNWKTTIGAMVTLTAAFLPYCGIHISKETQDAIVVLGIGIIGIFAKDVNVTGGNVKQ